NPSACLCPLILYTTHETIFCVFIFPSSCMLWLLSCYDSMNGRSETTTSRQRSRCGFGLQHGLLDELQKMYGVFLGDQVGHLLVRCGAVVVIKPRHLLHAPVEHAPLDAQAHGILLLPGFEAGGVV